MTKTKSVTALSILALLIAAGVVFFNTSRGLSRVVRSASGHIVGATVDVAAIIGANVSFDRTFRLNARRLRDCFTVLVKGRILSQGRRLTFVEATDEQGRIVKLKGTLSDPGQISGQNPDLLPYSFNFQALPDARYQRDRIYVRTSQRIRRSKARRKPTRHDVWRVDKVDMDRISSKCPDCQTEGRRRGALRCRTVQEMVFGRFSIKRRVVRYYYQPFWCPQCKVLFGVDRKLLGPGRRSRYGRSILPYMLAFPVYDHFRRRPNHEQAVHQELDVKRMDEHCWIGSGR